MRWGAAATAASAAATAVASAACPSTAQRPSRGNWVEDDGGKRSCGGPVDGEAKRYAPRFDGLRFIETLVTAHR